jgi:hypothetical protein
VKLLASVTISYISTPRDSDHINIQCHVQNNAIQRDNGIEHVFFQTMLQTLLLSCRAGNAMQSARDPFHNPDGSTITAVYLEIYLHTSWRLAN